MTDLHRAAEMALEALERSMEAGMTKIKVDQATAALRQALNVDAIDTSSTYVDENEKREHEGCAECGKKASEGWALYCVKCTELFKPDWDMIEPYHERIKELEIENEKLRQALARPEQKPVAYRVWDRMGGISLRHTKPDKSEYVEWDELYTAPPSKPWVSLTDEKIDEAIESCKTTDTYKYFRAIEAALRSKNDCLG